MQEHFCFCRFGLRALDTRLLALAQAMQGAERVSHKILHHRPAQLCNAGLTRGTATIGPINPARGNQSLLTFKSYFPHLPDAHLWSFVPLRHFTG
jgi:hypothetical protein